MPKKILIVFLLFYLIGCQSSTDKILKEVDTFMVQYPDSTAGAYALIKTIHPQQLSGKREKALYALLYTQAQYKNYDTIKSDSLIDIAVKYYTKHPQRERLASIYMYKGVVLSEMQLFRDAIIWYKKAEETVSSDDYMTMGLLNFRLGELYQRIYIENDKQLERYKKSLQYFKKTNNQKYQQTCLRVIGQIYRTRNVDSAYYYISKAIDLSKTNKDSFALFDSYNLLAGTYFMDKQYKKAKDLSLYIIQNTPNKINLSDPLSYIIESYIFLKQIDSAQHYYHLLPYGTTYREKLNVLLSGVAIEKAKKNYHAALDFYIQADVLSDSIMSETRKRELFNIEKQYDNHQLEKQNIQMHMQLINKNYTISLLVLLLLLIATLLWVFIRHKRTVARDNLALIESLQKESVESQNTVMEKLENESKLRDALQHQITAMKTLIELSYRHEEKNSKFQELFKKTVKLNKESDPGIWKDLQYVVNDHYNGILNNLKKEHPTLNEDDLNFMALMCCGFSYLEITICLGYTNERSTINRRLKITDKMGVKITLDNYLKQLMKK
ncbi:MAG: hypothetical protein RR555_10095 [Bacteroidales bacterium]